jgi:hypothetical protein
MNSFRARPARAGTEFTEFGPPARQFVPDLKWEIDGDESTHDLIAA